MWSSSAAFLNGTVVFLDHENISVDTKISIACHREAEILIEICFYIVAILKSNMAAICIVNKQLETFFFGYSNTAHHQHS